MYDEVYRSDEEINELLNVCSESESTGRSKYPGMTFEQGIKAGIEWLTDPDAEHPME